MTTAESLRFIENDKKMQKKIIIFITILFIACSIWLFAVSSDYLDPDKNKNWWTIYFSEPKSDENLNFIIENHSDMNNFRWIILEDRAPIKDSDISIKKGENNIIEFAIPQNTDIKKYTVEVYQGEEKKEIYKNIQ
jgi:hypothetical protein